LNSTSDNLAVIRRVTSDQYPQLVLFGRLKTLTYCPSIFKDYFGIQLPWIPKDNLSFDVHVCKFEHARSNEDPFQHVDEWFPVRITQNFSQLTATKGTIVIEWEVYSSVSSENNVISSVLQSNFSCTITSFKSMNC
jgi:hypothetical protein